LSRISKKVTSDPGWTLDQIDGIEQKRIVRKYQPGAIPSLSDVVMAIHRVQGSSTQCSEPLVEFERDD
jgi:hypothetical protein